MTSKYIYGYERAKPEKLFPNKYGKNSRQFRAQIGPAWQSHFCKPDISAAMSVIIFKQTPKDAHISELKIMTFLNQSSQPSEHK